MYFFPSFLFSIFFLLWKMCDLWFVWFQFWQHYPLGLGPSHLRPVSWFHKKKEKTFKILFGRVFIFFFAIPLSCTYTSKAICFMWIHMSCFSGNTILISRRTNAALILVSSMADPYTCPISSMWPVSTNLKSSIIEIEAKIILKSRNFCSFVFSSRFYSTVLI